MTTLPGPRPQFLRFVPRPANVGNRELAQARPVFIDNLQGGDSTAEIARLEGLITSLAERVVVLETT